MDQITPRPGSLRLARIPAGIVGTSVTAGAAAHVAAALTGPAGAMAWWMAAMGAACLACASPLALPARCAGRAAAHLLAMSAVMILIHLVLLVPSGAGGHHGTAAAAAPGHAGSMLAVIAVELACLMGASVALRLHRRTLSTTKEQP
ncbi:hypothetical protein [Arthrobacter celericrescens]|uniref:hypothetical protein n=1 Tax=Arthrobacter celericrescens TaxID=2320851 RepID=UPI000EA08B76|nr:hypothetical protein [Arthrobacter celericrescens]